MNMITLRELENERCSDEEERKQFAKDTMHVIIIDTSYLLRRVINGNISCFAKGKLLKEVENNIAAIDELIDRT